MLNKGDHVPRFECTTIDDIHVSYADLWQKKNLALVCLSEDDSPDAQSYIQELREAQKALAVHDAVVVVTTTPIEGMPLPGLRGGRSMGRNAVDRLGAERGRAPVGARDRRLAAVRRDSVPGVRRGSALDARGRRSSSLPASFSSVGDDRARRGAAPGRPPRRHAYVKRPEHITWNSDFTFCRLAYRRRQRRRRRRMGRRLSPRRHESADPAFGADQGAGQFRRDTRTESRRHSGDGGRALQMPVRDDERIWRRLHRRRRKPRRSARYLQKGGFLWVDDAWGEYAWQHWVRELRKVLPASDVPDHRRADEPLDSSTRCSIRSGFRRFRRSAIRIGMDEPTSGGTTRRTTSRTCTGRRRREGPHHGVHDAQHATSATRTSASRTIPTYFYNFSVEGYAIGINILLYAMTH